MGRLDDIQTAIVTAVTVFFTNMHGNEKDFGFIGNSFGRGSTNNQKTQPLQSKIFKDLWEDMGSTQKQNFVCIRRSGGCQKEKFSRGWFN